MVNFVKSFVMDESGASAAEYALILAIVGSAIALSAIALGASIKTSLDNAKANIDKGNSAT